MVEPTNRPEIEEFLEQNGSPDLAAGHRPVVAGFDTNLLAWRIADMLGLMPGRDRAINGFALATGIRDELDWEKKQSDTRVIEEAFGPAFEALWNQPAGARREGRLGENYYHRLRDHRYGDEFVTETGDDAIVKGYEEYQDESRRDDLLFSNHRELVERTVSSCFCAHRVELPDILPRRVRATWAAIGDTTYVSVLLGMLTPLETTR